MARSPESIEQRRSYARERYRSMNNPTRENLRHAIDLPSRINGKQNPEYQRAIYALKREHRLAQNREYRKRIGYKGRGTYAEMRQIVLSFLRQRDGGNCWICGLVVAIGTESVDHVIPVCRGGSHSHDNIKLAHLLCNLRRSRNG